MFDLYPMRALYLMTKRNFKSHGLQHKNKWSENFHDFLRNALQREPKRRPTAQELLKHDFVNRNALCVTLMLPLITVLEAPPPKSHTPVDEDTEEEAEEQEDKQQKKNFKRIASLKNQAKIGKQVSDADLTNLNLVPSSNHDNMAWPSTADDPNYRPGIQKTS